MNYTDFKIKQGQHSKALGSFVILGLGYCLGHDSQVPAAGSLHVRVGFICVLQFPPKTY